VTLVVSANSDRLLRLRRIGLLLGAAALCVWIGHTWALRKVLPAVIPVTVPAAQLIFAARLDTGAEVSSIHALEVEVIGGEGRPTRRDIGREIRFTVHNEAGEKARLTATVAGIHAIRTADCREYRYHVLLEVEFERRRAKILLNLNDRTRSAEKLLLGRNWLEHRYLIDVSR
jgi:hypothetical protein